MSIMSKLIALYLLIAILCIKSHQSLPTGANSALGEDEQLEQQATKDTSSPHPGATNGQQVQPDEGSSVSSSLQLTDSAGPISKLDGQQQEQTLASGSRSGPQLDNIDLMLQDIRSNLNIGQDEGSMVAEDDDEDEDAFGDKCAICHSGFKRDPAMDLRCRHKYHESCLLDYYRSGNKLTHCFLCMQPFICTNGRDLADELRLHELRLIAQNRLKLGLRGALNNLPNDYDITDPIKVTPN